MHSSHIGEKVGSLLSTYKGVTNDTNEGSVPFSVAQWFSLLFSQGLKDLALCFHENLCTSSTDYVVLAKTPLTLKENSPVGNGNHTKYDVEFVHFTSYLLS